MADYKIGQILTSTEEVEIEKALSGEKVIIPKGKDRKSTRLNSSHRSQSRMPSSA